jgi:hypothetical protein
VLAGAGNINGHLRVQVVRRRNRHHLNVLLGKHLLVIGKDAGNPVPVG